MKRITCPKCKNQLLFDEKKTTHAQNIIFKCPNCGKVFGIKLKPKQATKTSPTPSIEPQPEEQAPGYLSVIENVFHKGQLIPLHFGTNTIGKILKGASVDCPINTNDPSVDPLHCIMQVSADEHGDITYILRDGPSNTGTFVDNEILADNERRVMEPGALFTIGATSIILKSKNT